MKKDKENQVQIIYRFHITYNNNTDDPFVRGCNIDLPVDDMIAALKTFIVTKEYTDILGVLKSEIKI